jgi:hypothetical protein
MYEGLFDIMPTFSDLKSKCQKAITRQPPTDSEESVSVLCQNDWVRILTVYDSETLEGWRIEVEVSLPSQRDPQSGEGVKKFIRSLIRHLEYLLRLQEAGLTLGVISRDGLWTAYLELDNFPPDSLFNLLIPPSK